MLDHLDSAAIERHLPTLQSYVRRHMGTTLAARESCDDIVQSVCRELVLAGQKLQFPSDDALRTWLQTAAMHKILQKARHHRSQRRAVARETDDTSEIRDQRADPITPSRDASAREQVRQFEAALAQLSPDDREVITLIKLAGLSHAEAAARTGRSVEASRTLLRRALIRLSDLLPSEDHEPSPRP